MCFNTNYSKLNIVWSLFILYHWLYAFTMMLLCVIYALIFLAGHTLRNNNKSSHSFTNVITVIFVQHLSGKNIMMSVSMVRIFSSSCNCFAHGWLWLSQIWTTETRVNGEEHRTTSSKLIQKFRDIDIPTYIILIDEQCVIAYANMIEKYKSCVLLIYILLTMVLGCLAQDQLSN